LAICTDVLGVVQDPHAVLIECRRILKRDGTAIISVQNVEDQTFGTGRLIRHDDGMWEFEQAGLLFRFFEERTIKAIIEAVGLRVVNLERYVREDAAHRHRPVAHSHHLLGILADRPE
jgi:2-polyprenyl-3-methyl-5-hydroxy-6-metoxy-1,4-benzoquinol methylase